MTIAQNIHSFISSLSQVMFLWQVRPYGTDTSRLEPVYARSMKYIAVLVSFSVVTLSVGSRQFMSNWMGQASPTARPRCSRSRQ